MNDLSFRQPRLVSRSDDISGDSNFTQGCKFSPDGLCVLTSTSADNLLRLYNTPPQSLSQQETENENENEAPIETKDVDQSSKDDVTLWKTILSAKAGDSIRTYSWYPLMNSYQPASCAFITSCRDQPIHLIDAYNSSIRATYSPYNALDEMESPNVVTFTPDGNRIFAGGFRTDRTIHTFHTNIPGRDSDILRLGKTRRSKDGQKGIVSAISFPEGNSAFVGSNIFAVGTYSPGSIYVYDDRLPIDCPAGIVLHGGVSVVGHGRKKKRRFVDVSQVEDDGDQGTDDPTGLDDGEQQDIFSAAKISWYQARARTGITQLTWSKGGQNDYMLYSASRRSDAVLAFDMRMLSGDTSHPIQGVAAYSRDSDSNQRLEFDFDNEGRRLFVASKDSCVKVYDTGTGMLLDTIGGFHDAVNGVSYAEINGRELLSVACGARRFDTNDEDDEEDGRLNQLNGTDPLNPPGSLSLYTL